MNKQKQVLLCQQSACTLLSDMACNFQSSIRAIIEAFVYPFSLTAPPRLAVCVVSATCHALQGQLAMQVLTSLPMNR